MSYSDNNASTYRWQQQKAGQHPILNLTTIVKIFCSAIGVVLLLYAGCQVYSLLTILPYFKLTTIQVNGNKQLLPDQVMQSADLTKGQCMLEMDPAMIKERLQNNPYIKSAQVNKQLPHTLTIKIKERRGIALVNANSFYLLAEDGVIMSALSSMPEPGLPIITGIHAEEIIIGSQQISPQLKTGLTLLSLLRQTSLLANVSELCLKDNSNPVIYTKNDHIQIRLGESNNLAQKLKRLRVILTTINARRQQLKYIDLRFDQMVIVKFY